jgi:hypothetical protein
MRISKVVCFFIVVFFANINSYSWEGMPMPELHVDGRYLKDTDGHIVNLHGFAQTFSPWFNEQGSKWNNYNVQGCLNYNKNIIDRIMDAGWKVNFVRQHMDPYWSNLPGCTPDYHEAHNCFNETRFKKYLDEVFVPMAEYAISKGLYVVMRPPGVSPERIAIGDDYQQYLINVWGIVAKHPKLMNNPYIMFELANEPIDILGTDGTYGAGTQGHYDNLKTFFQTMVDTIRASADNILWIPGLGFQSLYAGFAVNPIEGENIGYAVHVYPGWFNSGNGYEPFQRGWDRQVQPVADFAPVIVTEMDWAPEHHGKSWGKDITGTAGGDGFGANFKKITDDCGNVSWLLFTEPHLLAEFGNPNAPADVVEFLTDPEACPLPIFNWFEEYAAEYDFSGVSDDYLTVSELFVVGSENISVLNKSSVSLNVFARFADGHTEKVGSVSAITVENPNVVNVVRGRIFALTDGNSEVIVSYTDPKGNQKQLTLNIASTTFPLTNDLFNPAIWENGTFDEQSRSLKTGPWGFGGWQFDGIDLSAYKYIVARLGSENNASIDFRVFDDNNYWGSPASFSFGNNREIVVPLKYAIKNDGTPLNPEHIFIAGFWSNGSNPFVIDSVFLSNSSEYDSPVLFANDDNGNRVTAINQLDYHFNSGPSESKQVVIYSDMLTNDIALKTSSAFEISLNDDENFSQNIEIMNNDGLPASTRVFVRLKAGLEMQAYKGLLAITSEGAQSYAVDLNGTVDQEVGVFNPYNEKLTILSTEYYSTTGQRIRHIENRKGVFIEVNRMSDGRRVVRKILNAN